MDFFSDLKASCKETVAVNQVFKRLPFVVIGIAVILRFIQYMADRSLWLDEALLASNITTRSFAELLQPLGHFQVAPIGFLFVEKALVGWLGNNEFVLRLFPFICGIFSLFLFWYVADYSLRKSGVLWALCLFGFTKYLIYYSAELKQYSSDVAMTLALYAAIIYIRKKGVFKKSYILLYGAAGAISIWFSLPSAFVLAGIGTSLFTFSALRRDWQRAGWLTLSFLFWLVSFAVFILIYMSDVSYNLSYQQGYWSNAFMPLPPLSVNDIKWFADVFFEIFQNPVGLTFTGLGALCFLCGAFSLFHEDKEWFFCLLGPTLFVLLVSGFRLYPFTARLLLFVAPCFYIFISHGIFYIWEKMQHISKTVFVALVFLLLMHPLFFATQQLITMKPNKAVFRENIKPVLNYLKEHKKPGDRVYLFHLSHFPFKYYAEHYDFSDLDHEVGTRISYDYKRDVKEIYQDLDRLCGSERVWLLFSHFKGEGLDYELIYLSYLEMIRSRKVESFKDGGASIYLYDLSKSTSKQADTIVLEPSAESLQ